MHSVVKNTAFGDKCVPRSGVEYNIPTGHSLLLFGLYSNEMLRRFQDVANNVQ